MGITFLEAVKEAKAAFLEINTADPETEADFTDIAKRIRRMIDRKSPYSGEMAFLLRGQRSANHPWIEDLLRA